MNSGLSHNSVLALLQDHDGYIWIGTRDGLNKFNGIDYVVYKHNFRDTLSLSNNQINCLLEGSDNSIWIGTANGLNRYNKSTGYFERFISSPDSTNLAAGNYIRSVFETRDKKIWISTTYGISCYDPTTSRFEHFFINPERTHPSNTIVSIYSGEKNSIWVGTRCGLYRFNDSRFQRIILDYLIEKQNDRFEIRDIQQDSEGTFWVGTEGFGLFSFKMEDKTPASVRRFYSGNSRIASDFVRKIFLSPEKTIWIGTIEGLSIFHKKDSLITNIIYSSEKPEGINDNSIRDIIMDNCGGYWIGTYAGGVNYFHPQNNLFPHFKKVTGIKNSLSDNAVSDFLENGKGNIWIATERGGLNYWDLGKNRFIHFKHHEGNSLPDDNVKKLASDKKGNLWIGTFNGLSVFNPETGKFSNFFRDTNKNNSLNHNQVHALYVDKTGLIWIGTNGGGLQVLNPEKQLFSGFPLAGRENVNVIREDGRGRLWIGSQNGLFCMERETRKEIDLSPVLKGADYPVIYVQCITDDSSGGIWVGTQGYGLYLIKNNKLFWFNTLNGLPDNTVNAIIEESNGIFWITTNQGLSKIIVSEGVSGIPVITSKQFTSSHGIQGKQFYPRSALKTRSGNLLFGGINGFNLFNPAEIMDTVFYPEILITNINIRSRSSEKAESYVKIREPFNEVERLKLKYNQRDVSIGFIGINFINPETTYYRYRLKGLDDKWIDLENRREINFAYLPVGDYELQIKASTGLDSWGESYSPVPLTILPPWYLTAYSSGFYVLFIGFLLFVFFRYSQKWARLKNDLAMEHFQREKEEELHQMKLRFFTDVSHELRTPLTLITAPLERITNQPDLSNRLRNQLLSIQRNSQRMMLLINKVLDLRKLETGHGKLHVAEDNIIEFLKETCLAFQDSAGVKNISLKFDSGVPVRNSWYDREKLEIILYNLLSNALKNTNPDGTIILRYESINQAILTGDSQELKLPGDAAVISVEDNGTGIPESILESIFKRFYTAESNLKNNDFGSGVGLELTKRLVELHKGIIKVESRVSTPEDSGFTKFSVFLPMNRKDYSDDEIDHEFTNSEDPSRYMHSTEKKSTISDSEGNGSSDLSKVPVSQRILIVEDNAELRKFIHELFEGRFFVEEAENGLIGWDIAVREIPDLIISDVMMPEMNGIELCRRIKTDIRTSHIPVILLTARTAITFRYEGLETGADDYITKPFSAEHLAIRVKNLIRQRELMRNHFIKEAICDPAKITVTSIDEKLLRKAVDFITKNISDKSIGVEKLSSEIGLSRVHFYRKIKALTNLTAVEFIRSIRLKRAASLLEQKKLSVKEVADMVGFEDTDYFRNSFRKQFGINPSEYPKNQDLN